MTQSLRERARQQGEGNGGRAEADPAEPVLVFEIGDDPEAVPVKVAWSRVMRFCRAVPKGGKATIKTATSSYSFIYRGIDDILNAVGPALRLFGAEIFPIEVRPTYSTTGRMNICTVVVTYRIESLGEGEIITQGAGEGADVGERATTKAQTYAYRNMLIAALCLPTMDPRLDADVVNVQRPEPPSPFALRDEMLEPDIRRDRLLAIFGELKRDPFLAGARVPVPDGKGGEREESLWDLNVRRGKELAAKQSAPAQPANREPEPDEEP
jgi:hypothetical protein